MKLITVVLETSLGAKYHFPDMEFAVAEKMVASLIAGDNYKELTLVNVSKACLVVPLRIVGAIFIDDVERWRR